MVEEEFNEYQQPRKLKRLKKRAYTDDDDILDTVQLQENTDVEINVREQQMEKETKIIRKKKKNKYLFKENEQQSQNTQDDNEINNSEDDLENELLKEIMEEENMGSDYEQYQQEKQIKKNKSNEKKNKQINKQKSQEYKPEKENKPEKEHRRLKKEKVSNAQTLENLKLQSNIFQIEEENDKQNSSEDQRNNDDINIENEQLQQIKKREKRVKNDNVVKVKNKLFGEIEIQQDQQEEVQEEEITCKQIILADENLNVQRKQIKIGNINTADIIQKQTINNNQYDEQHKKAIKELMKVQLGSSIKLNNENEMELEIISNDDNPKTSKQAAVVNAQRFTESQNIWLDSKNNQVKSNQKDKQQTNKLQNSSERKDKFKNNKEFQQYILKKQRMKKSFNFGITDLQKKFKKTEFDDLETKQEKKEKKEEEEDSDFKMDEEDEEDEQQEEQEDFEDEEEEYLDKMKVNKEGDDEQQDEDEDEQEEEDSIIIEEFEGVDGYEAEQEEGEDEDEEEDEEGEEGEDEEEEEQQEEEEQEEQYQRKGLLRLKRLKTDQKNEKLLRNERIQQEKRKRQKKLKQKVQGLFEDEAELGSDNEANDHLIKDIDKQQKEEQEQSDSEQDLKDLIENNVDLKSEDEEFAMKKFQEDVYKQDRQALQKVVRGLYNHQRKLAGAVNQVDLKSSYQNKFNIIQKRIEQLNQPQTSNSAVVKDTEKEQEIGIDENAMEMQQLLEMNQRLRQKVIRREKTEEVQLFDDDLEYKVNEKKLNKNNSILNVKQQDNAYNFYKPTTDEQQVNDEYGNALGIFKMKQTMESANKTNRSFLNKMFSPSQQINQINVRSNQKQSFKFSNRDNQQQINNKINFDK